MIRSFILFLVLSFVTINAVRPQQTVVMELSDSTAVINGKEYFIHTVKAKQTLFSIRKAYGIKISSIAFDNPGVLDGLQPGQYLRIPKGPEHASTAEKTTDPKLEVSGEYILYEVSAKQTLYAISKEYNTTITAMKKANPELADGLKVGMTIRIPVPQLLTADDPAIRKMVGLPVMEQMISKEGKQKVRIVLMLPFHLPMNDTIELHRMIEEDEEIYDRSRIALQFYEGFLQAVDTLAKQGYRIDLKVIDTENRPWKVQQLMSQGQLNKTDLIIGPFYSKVFKAVADLAYMNCIPVVSPTIKSNDIIKDNPFVYKMIPSEETMIQEMGKYLAASDSTHNMILHFGSDAGQRLVWKFRQGSESDSTQMAEFTTFNVSDTGKDPVRQHLSLIYRNNVVILSNDRVKLSSLVRKLSDWSEDAYIVGYAPNAWAKFKSLDVDHFDRLRLHMPMPFFVDHDDLETQLFIQEFRSRYYTEPSTFAYRGYDLAMHFIPHLNCIMEQGPAYMLQVADDGLQSKFGWKKMENGGFLNHRSFMVDHTDLNLRPAVD